MSHVTQHGQQRGWGARATPPAVTLGPRPLAWSQVKGLGHWLGQVKVRHWDMLGCGWGARATPPAVALGPRPLAWSQVKDCRSSCNCTPPSKHYTSATSTPPAAAPKLPRPATTPELANEERSGGAKANYGQLLQLLNRVAPQVPLAELSLDKLVPILAALHILDCQVSATSALKVSKAVLQPLLSPLSYRQHAYCYKYVKQSRVQVSNSSMKVWRNIMSKAVLGSTSGQGGGRTPPDESDGEIQNTTLDTSASGRASGRFSDRSDGEIQNTTLGTSASGRASGRFSDRSDGEIQNTTLGTSASGRASGRFSDRSDGEIQNTTLGTSASGRASGRFSDRSDGEIQNTTLAKSASGRASGRFSDRSDGEIQNTTLAKSASGRASGRFSDRSDGEIQNTTLGTSASGRASGRFSDRFDGEIQNTTLCTSASGRASGRFSDTSDGEIQNTTLGTSASGRASGRFSDTSDGEIQNTTLGTSASGRASGRFSDRSDGEIQNTTLGTSASGRASGRFSDRSDGEIQNTTLDTSVRGSASGSFSDDEDSTSTTHGDSTSTTHADSTSTTHGESRSHPYSTREGGSTSTTHGKRYGHPSSTREGGSISTTHGESRSHPYSAGEGGSTSTTHGESRSHPYSAGDGGSTSTTHGVSRSHPYSAREGGSTSSTTHGSSNSHPHSTKEGSSTNSTTRSSGSFSGTRLHTHNGEGGSTPGSTSGSTGDVDVQSSGVPHGIRGIVVLLEAFGSRRLVNLMLEKLEPYLGRLPPDQLVACFCALSALQFFPCERSPGSKVYWLSAALSAACANIQSFQDSELVTLMQALAVLSGTPWATRHHMHIERKLVQLISNRPTVIYALTRALPRPPTLDLPHPASAAVQAVRPTPNQTGAGRSLQQSASAASLASAPAGPRTASLEALELSALAGETYFTWRGLMFCLWTLTRFNMNVDRNWLAAVLASAEARTSELTPASITNSFLAASIWHYFSAQQKVTCVTIAARTMRQLPPAQLVQELTSSLETMVSLREGGQAQQKGGLARRPGTKHYLNKSAPSPTLIVKYLGALDAMHMSAPPALLAYARAAGQADYPCIFANLDQAMGLSNMLALVSLDPSVLRALPEAIRSGRKKGGLSPTLVAHATLVVAEAGRVEGRGTAAASIAAALTAVLPGQHPIMRSMSADQLTLLLWGLSRLSSDLAKEWMDSYCSLLQAKCNTISKYGIARLSIALEDLYRRSGFVPPRQFVMRVMNRQLHTMRQNGMVSDDERKAIIACVIAIRNEMVTDDERKAIIACVIAFRVRVEEALAASLNTADDDVRAEEALAASLNTAAYETKKATTVAVASKTSADAETTKATPVAVASLTPADAQIRKATPVAVASQELYKRDKEHGQVALPPNMSKAPPSPPLSKAPSRLIRKLYLHNLLYHFKRVLGRALLPQAPQKPLFHLPPPHPGQGPPSDTHSQDRGGLAQTRSRADPQIVLLSKFEATMQALAVRMQKDAELNNPSGEYTAAPRRAGPSGSGGALSPRREIRKAASMEPDDSRRRRQMPAPEQSKGQRLIGSFFKPATSADQQRERSAAEAGKDN
eukprot:gene29653-5072_t